MRATHTRRKTLLWQSGANALLGGHRPRYPDCDTTPAANGGAVRTNSRPNNNTHPSAQGRA
ncbi:hypothetical protein ACFLXQ_06180 [Chloroflexota bacterium]